MKNFEKHVTNYTVISNELLKRKEISDRARFLLICMLSLPDDWNFSIDGLQTIFTAAGKNTISACLKELQIFGYLRIEQARNTNGHFDSKIYHLYERPYTETSDENNPYPKNRDSVKNEGNVLKSPYPKKRVPDNEALLNTKYTNYLTNSKKYNTSNNSSNTNNSRNSNTSNEYNDINNISSLDSSDFIDDSDPLINSCKGKTDVTFNDINCLEDIMSLMESVNNKRSCDTEKKKFG